MIELPCSYSIMKPKEWIGPLLPLAMCGIQIVRNTLRVYLGERGLHGRGRSPSLEGYCSEIDRHFKKIGHTTIGGYLEMQKIIFAMYNKRRAEEDGTGEGGGETSCGKPDEFCLQVFGRFLMEHDPLRNYCGLESVLDEQTGDVIFACKSCRKRYSVSYLLAAELINGGDVTGHREKDEITIANIAASSASTAAPIQVPVPVPVPAPAAAVPASADLDLSDCSVEVELPAASSKPLALSRLSSDSTGKKDRTDQLSISKTLDKPSPSSLLSRRRSGKGNRSTSPSNSASGIAVGLSDISDENLQIEVASSYPSKPSNSNAVVTKAKHFRRKLVKHLKTPQRKNLTSSDEAAPSAPSPLPTTPLFQQRRNLFLIILCTSLYVSVVLLLVLTLRWRH